MTLDEFRNQKGWSYTKLAQKTGCAHAAVARRWCLPPDHPNHSVPATRFMRVIADMTDGEVQPNSFYALANDRR
tara:strand:+ start:1476 stop:1697 length:222 start_codon:yes stop_codon:yes gene_type:complete